MAGMPLEAQDLSKEERVPRRLRSPADATQDIFCLVKASMSSTSLSQPPLLVVPGSLSPEADHFLRVANTTDLMSVPEYDPERIAEIRKLHHIISADLPSLRRGMSWYQSILDRFDGVGNNGHQVPGPLTDLSFLRNTPCNGPSLHDFQLGARPPPVVPHSLQVVFHH